MKRSTFPKRPFPLASYVPAVLVLAVAFALLAWAFVQPELSADQRVLANCFFALLAGSAVYLWSGMILSVHGHLGQHVRVALKAVGGSAAFTFALLHPLFLAPNASGALPAAPARRLEVISP